MAWEQFADFTSSNISSLKYESGQMILEVAFHGGGVYQYFDVPQVVWERMKAAPSQGIYLNAEVKGHYRYSKV